MFFGHVTSSLVAVLVGHPFRTPHPSSWLGAGPQPRIGAERESFQSAGR